MFTQVLISVGEKDTRIATLEDGQLVHLQVQREGEESLVGNIYKGKIGGVVSGLQAAFVDIGQEKNAFLHFSDVLPESLDLIKPGKKTSKKTKKTPGRAGSRNAAWRNRPVEKMLKNGQEVLVQVTKDPINTKGPRVTSALSLPGRYLVLLPFPDHTGGVSKRVEDQRERRRLRNILRQIESKDRAHIVRTAGIGRNADEIKLDVGRLDKEWAALMRRQSKGKNPSLIHDDQDFIYRFVRDSLNSEINEIWVDTVNGRDRLKRHLKTMVPEMLDHVVYHKDNLESLFEYFDVERQVRRAIRRKVWLKSGGHLIFDEMEAMTAIDVNSGKYTGKGDQTKMIVKTNTEAAQMVARQLRLRDIGGLIVIDFIDMEKEENRRSVQGELKAYLRHDHARLSVAAISEFGLVEMTRQRVRESLRKQLHRECPHCQGEGLIPSDYEIWREIKDAALAKLLDAPRPNLEIRCHRDIASYIDNEVRETFTKIERLYRISIEVLPTSGMRLEGYEIKAIAKPGARARKKSETKAVTDEDRRSRWKQRRDLYLESHPEPVKEEKAAPEKNAAPPPEENRRKKKPVEPEAPREVQAPEAEATGEEQPSSSQKRRSRRRRGGKRNRSRSAQPPENGEAAEDMRARADALIEAIKQDVGETDLADSDPEETASAPETTDGSQSQETTESDEQPKRSSRRRRGSRRRGSRGKKPQEAQPSDEQPTTEPTDAPVEKPSEDKPAEPEQTVDAQSDEAAPKRSSRRRGGSRRRGSRNKQPQEATGDREQRQEQTPANAQPDAPPQPETPQVEASEEKSTEGKPKRSRGRRGGSRRRGSRGKKSSQAGSNQSQTPVDSTQPPAPESPGAAPEPGKPESTAPSPTGDDAKVKRSSRGRRGGSRRRGPRGAKPTDTTSPETTPTESARTPIETPPKAPTETTKPQGPVSTEQKPPSVAKKAPKKAVKKTARKTARKAPKKTATKKAATKKVAAKKTATKKRASKKATTEKTAKKSPKKTSTPRKTTSRKKATEPKE